MQRVLRLSLIATIAYVVLTLVAGLRAHSLALVSEAGHNASDALAIVLSFVAVWFQTRPATEKKTFGYQRAGVLAAFLNALTLIFISVWIALEAVHRFTLPANVQPRIMMFVAAAGVIMNGLIAAMLWRVSHDINIRSVFIHMLGDTLSTAAVIVGGASHFAHRRNLDRPRPFARHRRSDSLVVGLHRARDPQHPPRRHAARPLTGRNPHHACRH